MFAGARESIIVPVQVGPCRTPSILKHMCSLKYSEDEYEEARFWERLALSIQTKRDDKTALTNEETFKSLVLNLPPSQTINREDIANTSAVTNTCTSTFIRNNSPSSVRESEHIHSNNSSSKGCVGIRVVPDDKANRSQTLNAVSSCNRSNQTCRVSTMSAECSSVANGETQTVQDSSQNGGPHGLVGVRMEGSDPPEQDQTTSCCLDRMLCALFKNRRAFHSMIQRTK